MNPVETGNFDKQAAKSQEARVWEMVKQGDNKQAVAECEKLNRLFPKYASGWYTTSHLMLLFENPRAALTAVEQALSFDSAAVAWLLQKGLCLVPLGRIADLGETLEKLSPEDMKTPYQCSALGMLEAHLGRREQAVKCYERAIKLQPSEARHYYNLACMQRSLGDLEGAENNFDSAVRLNPTDYESFKIRSDLRKQTAERNHVAELKGVVEAEVANERGRVQVCYALAKELEDLGEFEESFSYLKQGSEQRRKLMRYDVKRDLETIEAIKRTFSQDVFEATKPGCSNAEAIFVLGMPRTGTTLVERILASHTDVFAAGELNNFAAQLMVMVRAQNADKRVARDEMVSSSAKLDFAQLGESYIESTRPFTGKTPRFIDKMPLNYLYVGLIHLALPNAKIINVQRDPMDTCYAIYKQLFVDAYPFSYDLRELGQYYQAYHRLMEHWNRVLPGVIHTVKYEQLVGDIEVQTRALLSACDLDWQPECLSFYENKEASTTASAAQIRRPVYKSSIGKWRNYEEQLAPLSDMLRELP
jgi:tetratricopeptide (TPR) repeat protein